MYAIIRRIIIYAGLFSTSTFEYYSDIEFIVVSILSTLLLFRAIFIFDPGSVNRKVIMLLTVGNFLWMLGELTFILYLSILQIDPFPSVADLFYLAGYFPTAVALGIKANTVSVKVERYRLISSLVALFVYGLFTLNLLIMPIYQYQDISELERWVLITYPVLDTVLVVVSVYLFATYAGGKLEGVWVLFLLSSFTDAMGDTIWGYEDWHETYNAVSWADDIYIWAYLFVILFAVYMFELFAPSEYPNHQS